MPAARLFHACVVLCCVVLSVCRARGSATGSCCPFPQSADQLKTNPCHGRAHECLKHGGSQVGLVLADRPFCFLGFNDARQCKTFKAHPQVYSMFLVLFWDWKKKTAIKEQSGHYFETLLGAEVKCPASICWKHVRVEYTYTTRYPFS